MLAQNNRIIKIYNIYKTHKAIREIKKEKEVNNMSDENMERLERIVEGVNKLDDSDKVVVEAFLTGYKSGLLAGHIKNEQKAG